MPRRMRSGQRTGAGTAGPRASVLAGPWDYFGVVTAAEVAQAEVPCALTARTR
jgi:hypothetical protein